MWLLFMDFIAISGYFHTLLTTIHAWSIVSSPKLSQIVCPIDVHILSNYYRTFFLKFSNIFYAFRHTLTPNPSHKIAIVFLRELLRNLLQSICINSSVDEIYLRIMEIWNCLFSIQHLFLFMGNEIFAHKSS